MKKKIGKIITKIINSSSFWNKAQKFKKHRKIRLITFNAALEFLTIYLVYILKEKGDTEYDEKQLVELYHSIKKTLISAKTYKIQISDKESDNYLLRGKKCFIVSQKLSEQFIRIVT